MKDTTKKIGVLLIPLLFYFGLTGYGATITPTVTSPCTPNTGAVTFSITGGTSGYTFYLSRADYGFYANYTPQSSPTFTGLPSGTYYIYASNSQDSVSANFTISSLVTATPTITNATCTQSNGSAIGVASGGTGPYTYHWVNSNYSTIGTGTSVSSEPAGSYYVIATDQNGCVSDTTPVAILASSPITATLTSNGSTCNPILTVAASGGAVPYGYAWNTGAAATTSINATNSGLYSVSVTDANGCTAAPTINVNVIPLYVDSSNAQVTNPTCIGNNGTITIHLANGTAPYIFAWSNSGPNDSSIIGLVPGTYTVSITDAHGCTGSATYYLSTTPISVYISASTTPTCGASDGSVTATGYNGTAPYTYVWSPSGSGATLSSIPSGTYTVTATDANLCTASTYIALTPQGNYHVTVVTTPTACDTTLHTGTATAVITGTGFPPYNFQWYDYGYYPPVLIGTTQTISNLSYGQYFQVTVTDSTGCVPNNYQYQDSGSIGFDPSCYDHITGYVFLDSNANCTFGAGDPGVAGANVFATSGNTGQTYYAVSDSTGYYDIEVIPGTYTVQYNLFSYGYCTATSCIASYPASFSAIGLISSGNNFGLSLGSAFDLGVHPGTRPSAPGSQKEYWVYYYNYGSVGASNTTVSFTYDPSLTLVSTAPSYSSISGNTITWNVGTVAPTTGNWFTGYLHMWFNVPSTDSLNQILYAQAEIDPISGDCNHADNIVNISDVVTGSHDPNAKSVSPAGNLSATDTVLTYTILFENDGNAPANTIVIVDTLSPNVNPATFQPGASSFPGYKYSITGKGIVTFTFQGINLPVGVANQGFVSYSVQTKKDLPLGSQVDNTAYVFFDENPAVITNTTTNIRSNYPTGISSVSGGTMSAKVVPNPANDRAEIQFTGYTGTISLHITDEVGNVIFIGTASDNTYVLDAQRLSTGIYFYTATDANGNKAAGKISIVH